AIIWERRDADQARHSLSGALRALRQALGDSDGKIIVPSSDPLECRFDALDVDAPAMKRAAKEGTPQALELIEAIYAGDLLEGLPLRSAAFEEWLAVERTQFQAIAIDALARLMTLRAEVGDADKAIDTAQRLLELDGLREDAHRLLARAHLMKQNRWAAL